MALSFYLSKQPSTHALPPGGPYRSPDRAEEEERRVAADDVGDRHTARRAHGPGRADRQRVRALEHGLSRGPAEPAGLVGPRCPALPERDAGRDIDQKSGLR